MAIVKKWSVRGRIMSSNKLVGYVLLSPDGVKRDVDNVTACNMARQGLINNVRVSSDNKLVSNGIRLGNLPVKQV